MNQIFTAGYSGHTPAQLRMAADKLGALVVDIRHKPISRIPGWSQSELNHILNGGVGEGYCHFPPLGNVAAGTGRGILLADPVCGIPTIIGWAARRPLILLCGCADFAECHRARVSQLLAMHGVQTQELKWPELNSGTLKAISLWQPWASLIAIGAKRIETRGWATSYRGPLHIHAAKRTSEFDYCAYPSFWNALHRAKMWRIPDSITETFTERSIQRAFHELTIKQRLEWLPLPLGALVAVVDMVDCVPTEKLKEMISLDERAFGNYDDNRFGWVLENVRRIEPAVPYRGAQGFFSVDPAVLTGVLE